MIVKKEIINEHTGQVTTTQKEFPDIFNEDGYLLWTRKKQCRVFNDIELPKELDYSEKGRIFNLIRYIEKNTNCLVKRTSVGYTHLNESDMIKELDLCEKKAKTLLNKYIKLGVVARVNIKHTNVNEVKFFINPMYFHSGNRLSKTLYRLFAESMDEFMEDWVKKEMARE